MVKLSLVKNNSFIIKNNSFNPLVVIDDYCQFSGGKKSEVIEKIKKSIEIASKTWEKTVPKKNTKNLEKFYASKTYIYDLLDAFYDFEKTNKIKTCLDIVRFIKRKKAKKVLEFGGGTGQLCLLLHFNTDASVSYLDLPGNTFELAKWRFKKYKAPISLIKGQINADEIAHSPFDVIVSDAVLEHVPNLQKTIKLLKKSLKLPGYLYLLFDPDFGKKRPMHLCKITDFYNILKKEGFIRIGEYIWTNEKSLENSLKEKVLAFKKCLK